MFKLKSTARAGAARAFTWLLPAVLAAMAFAGCSTKNEGVLPGPQLPGGNGNTAVIGQETTVNGNNGASAVVPAGTTVTSSAVNNGAVDLGSTALPANVQQSFEDNANFYGGIGFTPLDATFSQPVTVRVPAGSASGTVNVYRYNNSAASAVPGWTQVGSAAPSNGVVEVTTTSFGYFAAGDEMAVSMPEISNVSVPANLEDGVDATWSVEWSGGAGPFTVDWNFGGGADPNTANFPNATSPSSGTVNMVNTTDADASYTYTVEVTDNNGNGDTMTGSFTVAASMEEETFTLTIFHNNDGESQLLNAGSEELPDGNDLSNFGGAAHFVTKVEELTTEAAAWADATVTLSSGDNFLAGAEFNASQADGVYYDALVLEAIGYDAICLGNHDFDFGPDVLADFINEFETDPVYLSCNLDFSGEANLQALVGGRIFPSTIVEKNGVQIGIIGATTENLDFISSPRGVSEEANLRNTSTLDAESSIQAEIDALESAGVDIIILISHLQGIGGDYGDEQVIGNLSGVDVAIAGGGDELLADGGAAENLIPGDETVEGQTYPLLFDNADGVDVPVVTTPGNYKYVGMLTVEFDADGNLLGVVEEHSGLQRVANSVYPDAVAADSGIQASVIDPVSSALDALDNNVIATTEVPLNGRRGGWDDVNGEPSIVGVRNSETNLGNIDADALLWQARQLHESFSAPYPHVGLQNGGGMRNDAIIPAGDITELDTFDINAFPNFVTILEGVTHAQLRDITEAGVSGVQNTSGGFLQVAGMRFEYDLDGDPYQYGTPGSGTRVHNLWLDTGLQIVCDGVILTPNEKVNIATIDFLARGGDNSPFEGDELYTLGVSYQQALVNYLVDGLGGVVTAEMYPYEGEDGEGEIYPAERRIQTVTSAGFELSHIGTYDSGLGEGSTEIVAYDPSTRKLFTTNAAETSVSVIDFSDPANPVDAGTSIDISSYGEPNSCAVSGGILAVAVANTVDEQAAGLVNLYDTSDLSLISSNPAGVLPDMVTFTHDGTKVVVANEGEPNDDYTVDPEGSVTVIDISVDPASPVITQIPFTSLNAEEAALQAEGVRIFGLKQPGDVPSTVAEDLEPEYISVSHDDSVAYVSCQENNCLVQIDLTDNSIIDVMALGTKDWSAGGPMLDISNEDGPGGDPAINLGNWPIQTFYMPDAIAGYCAGGEFYIVTANEGDARDYDGYSEEDRCKDLTLDPAAFPGAATLQEDGQLGRFKITYANGDTDDDGDYDEIYGYGGRSFSIWNSAGLVWDSGDEFETYTSTNYPAIFNMNDGLAEEWDQRSDDKGPEPEGVDVGHYRGTAFAFIGLERQGGMFAYDISDPSAPVMVDYYTTDPTGAGMDSSPEGVLFIPAADSPTGRPLVCYSTELSGTVVVWQLDVAGS